MTYRAEEQYVYNLSRNDFILNFDMLNSKFHGRQFFWKLIKNHLEEYQKEVYYVLHQNKIWVPIWWEKDGIDTDVFPSVHSIAKHLWLPPNNVGRAAHKWWKCGWYNFYFL